MPTSCSPILFTLHHPLYIPLISINYLLTRFECFIVQEDDVLTKNYLKELFNQRCKILSSFTFELFLVCINVFVQTVLGRRWLPKLRYKFLWTQKKIFEKPRKAVLRHFLLQLSFVLISMVAKNGFDRSIPPEQRHCRFGNYLRMSKWRQKFYFEVTPLSQCLRWSVRFQCLNTWNCILF